MDPVIVGTHTCDIVQSTTANGSGVYSFTVNGDTINGTVYKSSVADAVVLPSAPVDLLQSRSDSKYAVMCNDPDFWGCRIAPYPPAAAPFTQHLSMGFLLNARFQIDSVYTNDVRLTLVFTAYDVNSGLECRFVWGGGEGVDLLTNARVSAIVSDTVGGAVGTVKHYVPAQEKLCFPNGEGAACQRYDTDLSLADYRDPSAATAVAGFRVYVTAATLHYSGDEETQPYAAFWNLPLDGTATICNYEHSTIHITGRAGAAVTVYTRSAGNSGFAYGYYETVSLGGGGAADLEDLPAGEYVLLAHDSNGGGFTYAAAPVTVEVGWGETVNASVTLVAFEPDGDDLFQGWWFEAPGVPLANHDIYVEVVTMDGEDIEGCRTAVLGTTDEDGYGPVGHDGKEDDLGGSRYDDYNRVWVEGGAFGGFCAQPEEPDWRPFRAVGSHVVIKQPKLALLYHGQGEYEHLYGRGGGFHLEPGADCPAGAANVPLIVDPLNGWMHSEVPVPRMAGTWDPCVDADPPTTQCKWELWAGGTLLDANITLEAIWISGGPAGHPIGEYDAGQDIEEYTVAGRIRGAHVDWSTDALAAPEASVDRGLEFGEYTAPPFRVIAEANAPGIDGYVHSMGWVAHVCPYCGKAAKHDPADGASRGYCPDTNCQRDARAYWDVFPCGEGGHGLHVVTSDALQLLEERVERRAWYEGQDRGLTAAYQHSPSWPYRYLAKHVVMATFDHSTGFAAGTGMAERGLAVGRAIGPAQPKLEILEVPSADVEVRFLCERTDDSEAYFYATVTPFHAVNEIVPMTWVLRDTGAAESSRRRLARIYEADLEGWPCVSGDAVDECTNAWAKDGAGVWQLTAPWLSSGQWRVVNDNPSYRHTEITVTRTEVSPYVAQLYVPTPSLSGDLRRDYAGRVWIAAIDAADDLYVSHIPHELQGPSRWVLVSSAKDYSAPSICPLPDGRLLLAVRAATVLVAPTGAGGALQMLAVYETELRLSKNDGETWEVIGTPHLADDLELVYIFEQHGTGVVFAVGVDADSVYVEYSTDQGDSKAAFRSGTRVKITDLTLTNGAPRPAGEGLPDGSLLVATEDDNGSKLWTSRDRGETWSQVT